MRKKSLLFLLLISALVFTSCDENTKNTDKAKDVATQFAQAINS